MKIIPNITYKSVLQGIKNIKERNKAFDALDEQSQRMEIAWDTLQLITSNKVKGSNGSYWDRALLNLQVDIIDEIEDGMISKEEGSKEFQKTLIKKLPESCKVCARGGVMLSLIRLGNKISPTESCADNGDRDTIRAFDMDSMYNMESEYEKSSYKHPYCHNSTEKLANIYCNVLVNGFFNTKDKSNYLIIEY